MTSSGSTTTRRQAEFRKYADLYFRLSRSDVTGAVKPYGLMAPNRGSRLLTMLSQAWLDGCRSFLDVGCGPGWLIDHAPENWRRRGYEVVEKLCNGKSILHFGGAHDIPEPDRSWDLVVCSDVLEHILEEDLPAVLSELHRVANKRVYATISHRESIRDGMNLHVTMKPLDWWLPLLKETWGHFEHCHVPGKAWTEVWTQRSF